MKTVRHWPPMRVGAAWIKRTEIDRRTTTADVFVAWIRLEDGRPASTSRSIAKWGRNRARALVLEWIQKQRAGIRKRSKLAPYRFPEIVVRR
jgi:hypothetical protein